MYRIITITIQSNFILNYSLDWLILYENNFMSNKK